MTIELRTRWIDQAAAERIMAELIRGDQPVPGFPIADRDRSTYLYGALYELAYAVTTKSANPAAMAPGPTNATARGYADRRLMSWASKAARSLDAILDEL